MKRGNGVQLEEKLTSVFVFDALVETFFLLFTLEFFQVFKIDRQMEVLRRGDR